MFVIDIEISLDEKELMAFKELSEQLDAALPDVYRRCANERCVELLDRFNNNVPTTDESTTEDEHQRRRQDNPSPTERQSQFNEVSSSGPVQKQS